MGFEPTSLCFPGKYANRYTTRRLIYSLLTDVLLCRHTRLKVRTRAAALQRHRQHVETAPTKYKKCPKHFSFSHPFSLYYHSTPPMHSIYSWIHGQARGEYAHYRYILLVSSHVYFHTISNRQNNNKYSNNGKAEYQKAYREREKAKKNENKQESYDIKQRYPLN